MKVPSPGAILSKGKVFFINSRPPSVRQGKAKNIIVGVDLSKRYPAI
jgi:hypothetical protein